MPQTQRTKKNQARSFHSIDWRDDGDIIDFVNSRWDTRPQRMKRWEKQWFVNIAQYLGHQWLVWDDGRESMVQAGVPPWRVRLTANLLMGVSRKIVSKILRARPTWSVVPATGESEDIMSARIGEKVLRYYWGGPLNMDDHMVDLFTWMTTTGNAFLRVMWDPRKGNEVSIASEDVKDQKVREDVKKILKGKNKRSVNLGDLECEVVTPFEIDPDPAARRLSEATHLIHTKARSIDWVKDRYGEAAKDLDADGGEGVSRHFQKRIAELGGPGSFGGVSSDSEDNDGLVLVHELWTGPLRENPRGLYVVVAGDRVLARQQNEWRFAGRSCLPYVHFKEIEVPGRFWGTCALEQAIPIQADYNRARSQLIESRNLMSRPKWLVPKGANIGDMALTSEPGEVVEYTPGLRPEAWIPPPLPPYVMRTIEANRVDLQDVTQIHDVTQGKAPGRGVRSGVAIAALQEQDDTVLAPTMMLISRGLERIGAMSLEMISRKVREPRLIKLVGKNNLLEAETFLGKDLFGANNGKPGVNYFDVKIQMGSQLPLNKQAKADFIMQLANIGLINPETDRRQILEMFDIGTDEPLFDAARLDTAAARQENRVLSEPGNFVSAMPYDDNEAHIIAHRLFQKTPDFLRLIEKEPSVLQQFEAHIAEHEQILQGGQAQPGPPEAVAQGQVPPELVGPPPELSPEDQLLQAIAQQRMAGYQ